MVSFGLPLKTLFKTLVNFVLAIMIKIALALHFHLNFQCKNKSIFFIKYSGFKGVFMNTKVRT